MPPPRMRRKRVAPGFSLGFASRKTTRAVDTARATLFMVRSPAFDRTRVARVRSSRGCQLRNACRRNPHDQPKPAMSGGLVRASETCESCPGSAACLGNFPMVTPCRQDAYSRQELARRNVQSAPRKRGERSPAALICSLCFRFNPRPASGAKAAEVMGWRLLGASFNPRPASGAKGAIVMEDQAPVVFQSAPRERGEPPNTARSPHQPFSPDSGEKVAARPDEGAPRATSNPFSRYHPVFP
jgi:hypothetical protein